MRLTHDQALARLQSATGTGMRKAAAKPLKLVTAIQQTRADRVFVFGNDERMLIAPADDALPAIIGECEPGEMPPNMRHWLTNFARDVKWWQEKGRKLSVNGANTDDGTTAQAAPMRAAKATEKTVNALIKTKWNQTAPYNQNLIFDGQQCLVGCGAISLAQIVYYWATKGYHRGCLKTPKSTSKTQQFAIAALPPVTVFDYNHMTTSKPTTAEAKKAVADFLEYCGKAMRMDYGVNCSTSYATYEQTALKKYFRMGSNIRFIYAWQGAAAFEEAVKAELLDGCPVMMSGRTPDNASGHSFVCDGWRATDGFFHFNWGWGGSCNGWFAMSALTPSSTRDYTAKKTALIGIKPEYILGDVNGDGKINMTDVAKVLSKSGDTAQMDVNSDGKVDYTDASLIVQQITKGDAL